MSTLSIVLLVLAGAAFVALRVWAIAPWRNERPPNLPGDPRDWREASHIGRLLKRDPAAARALGNRLEAALQAEYDSLRERAATDPGAAAAFAKRATDELEELRVSAAYLARKARSDAETASFVAWVQLQIERVERDLAWARELAAPKP
jgi:hypothetical protein